MLKDKIIEIFVPADDFCISFAENIQRFRLVSSQGRDRYPYLLSLWLLHQLQALL
jgi:hypothetical protein